MSNLLRENKKLMMEYNYSKNKDVNLDNITLGSNRIIWWKCLNNHEWEAAVNKRSSGYGCPICSNRKILNGVNDLMTTNPELKKWWNNDKNVLKMDNCVAGSAKKVWWKCPKGHEWEEEIRLVVTGCRCPYCSGHRVLKGFNDIETIYPELLDEWDYDKNTITPDSLTKGSHAKVWWKCDKGHSWEATISHRTNGQGCPYCYSATQTSFAEQTIYYYLSKEYSKVVNRYKDGFLNGMELDIFIPKIDVGIEYDGYYFHIDKSQNNREKIKYELCKSKGIKLIRIREKGLKKSNNCDYNIISLWNGANYESLDRLINELFNYLKLTGKINTWKDRLKIEKLYRNNFQVNNSFSKKLLDEWNYEKNNNLKLENFSVHSGFKAWWKCPKGHEWISSIAKRTMGRNCPYCSNKKVLKGYNDLETFNPLLSKEWDYEKNKTKPSDYLPFSSKHVWWKCSKGHEWMASIAKRSLGRNCPYCANKKVLKGYNDLVTINPSLKEEWNYAKNKSKPEEYIAGSSKKVWWKCKKCGNEWIASINKRNHGRNCPKCQIEHLRERKSKKVLQFSLEGTLIAEYNSVVDAKLKTGIKAIYKVCSNERKTAGGYIWKYK